MNIFITLFLLVVSSAFGVGLNAAGGKVAEVATPTATTDAPNKAYHDDPANIPGHSLLSTQHSDTTAGTVSRGSIIIGDSTPKWSELTIGTDDYILLSDGTDINWADINTSGIIDHTLTTTWKAIQGGTTNEYFHLTDAEWTELTEWMDDVILYDNGDTDLVTHDLNTTGMVRGGLALFGGVGEFRADAAELGTPTNPYLIFTYAELADMANHLSSSYRLAADIDAAGNEWVPIGNSTTEFTGTFDGGGHIISNLTMNKAGVQLYQGFFGEATDTTIQNVKLINISYTETTAGPLGGLVGDLHGTSTVSDCFVSGTINMGTASLHVGGLIGYATGIAAIQRCGVDVNISGGSNGTSGVGGLIGQTVNNVDITDCYAKGDVTYTGSFIGLTTGFGSFVGYVADNGTGQSYTNCYATGEISQKNWFEETNGCYTKMGFVGYSEDRTETYTDCFWDNEATGAAAAGSGRNEVQQVTMTGIPTAGTYTITFDGQSAEMDWNDPFSEVQTKLDAVWGAGTLILANPSWPSDYYFRQNYPLKISFAGAYLETDVAMVVMTDNLTNGTINAPTEYKTAVASFGAADDMNGATTAQMKTQATFDTGGSAWDFTTVWEIVEGVSYPTLRAAPENPYTTNDIHRFGTTTNLRQNVIADSGDNVLLEGDLELQGTQLVLGDGTAADYTIKFNASNDGVVTWDESAGDFLFNNDVQVTGVATSDNFVSDVAIGTSPYACTSTTLNTNLNADLWDGYQFSDYLDQAVKQASSPTFANITDSGLTAGRVTYAGASGLLQDSANLTFDGTSFLIGIDHATKQSNLSYSVFSNTTESWASTTGGIVRAGLGSIITSGVTYTTGTIGSDFLYGLFGNATRTVASSSSKWGGFVTRGLEFTATNSMTLTDGASSAATARALNLTKTAGTMITANDSQTYNNATEYWYTQATGLDSTVLVAPVIAAAAGVETLGKGLNIAVTTTDAGATHTSTGYGIYLEKVTGADINWGIFQATAVNNALYGNTRIGSTTAPTVALDVTGAATISGLSTLTGGSTTGDGTNKADVSSTGDISFAGTAGIVLPHMMQSDSTDQAITDATEEQIITFDTDVHHSLITRTSSSRFTITKAGSYLITISAMVICSDASPVGKQIAIWMKKGGVNVDNSSTYYSFKGQNSNTIITVNFLYHFDASDYFEFWMYGNDTDIRLDAIAAVADSAGVTPAIPACPSIIMTCNYIGKD